MKYEIKEGQNIFIEITNPVHGGEGWDFSEVLWSPAKSNWNIMTTIKEGDLIIHSLKENNQPHKFVGVSLVSEPYTVIDEEPLKPDRWKGYDSYYRVPLAYYSKLQKELPLSEFYTQYNTQLVELGEQHSFYSLSNDKQKVHGTAQKYMALVPEAVKKLLLEWLEKEGIEFFELVEMEQGNGNSTITGGNRYPVRVETRTQRIIRDTEMVRNLKKEYDYKCQICGKTITLPNGKKYVEGHHLKKLGGVHLGPDVRGNIIILCPYHHAEFDYGVIGINSSTKKIVHIDENNEWNDKELAYGREDLEVEYLEYHMQRIFNK